MNKPGSVQKILVYTALVLLVLFLIGFMWFRKKSTDGGFTPLTDFTCPVRAVEDGSQVLVTMGDTPIVSVDMLETEYNNLLEKNAQLKMLADIMPNLKEQFYEGVVASKIVDRYISSKGLDQTAAYQQELAEFTEAIKQQLNKKYFSEKIPVTVSIQESKELYDQHKDQSPDILLSQGGVNAEGVKFNDNKNAQTFMSQVIGKAGKFHEIAKNNNLDNDYHDFRLVNDKSVGMDAELRDDILNITTIPTITIVKSGPDYWVVNVKSKEEKKYRPFAELQEMIEETIVKQKRDEVERDLIEKLKKEYEIDESKAREYFKVNTPMVNTQLDMDSIENVETAPVETQPVSATRTV